MLKCTKINFGWGLALDPAWELTALPAANLPNRYSARPVTHAQTWASYSALYRFGRLSLPAPLAGIADLLLWERERCIEGKAVRG